jgi:hypothetical protein
LNRLEEHLSLAPIFPFITYLYFSGEGYPDWEFVPLMKHPARDLNGIALVKMIDSFATRSTSLRTLVDLWLEQLEAGAAAGTEGETGMKVGWRWAAVACAVGAAMFAALGSDKPVQTMGLVLLMMLWVGCLVEMVCEAIRASRTAQTDAQDPPKS